MTILRITAAALALGLAMPAVAAHGPYSADSGKTPGGFEPSGTNKAAPATRAPGENGAIASGAEKGNPTADGTNDTIDDGEGGLFGGQSEGFPGSK
ncbi:hypothetical protein [Litorisediminicola beolgyonensis]|uniref:Uncharacterized protein n=1 Tax=Litorisediminicola beolgyonensis TaxID=1173614 RepID=A0ABW3ZCZ9_9RHOB